MTAPLVQVAGVSAADQAGLRGRPKGYLGQLQLELGSGVFAVLGAPEDGSIALPEVLAGLRPAARGTVRVGGRDPARDRNARARIGALMATAQLPDAPDVAGAVARAMKARGQAADPGAVLDPVALGPLARRRLSTLTFAEARSVELAIALSTPSPLLMVLYEPLADVSLAPRFDLAGRLRGIAEGGACVLVVTSSPADARSLGDAIFVLHRGAIVRHGPSEGRWLGAHPTADGSVASPVELVAWVRHGARALAARLTSSSQLAAVALESQGSPEAPDAGVVRIRTLGGDDEGGLALVDAAVEVGAVIEAVSSTVPALAEVRSSTHQYFAAMHAAHRAAWAAAASARAMQHAAAMHAPAAMQPATSMQPLSAAAAGPPDVVQALPPPGYPEQR